MVMRDRKHPQNYHQIFAIVKRQKIPYFPLECSKADSV